MHHFRLYDLAVESEWMLPGVRLTADGEPQVSVRSGATPHRLDAPLREGACFQARPGEMLIWLDGVARFWVSGGREIVVERAPASEATTVATLLASAPLAALLLQRGILPLQASAVNTPKGAVLFLGGAGAGKSTLAAEFARRGFQLLGDDLAAIRVAPEDAPRALPGAAALRLWPHTIEALTLAGDFPLVRPGSDRRVVDFPSCVASDPAPLAAIYVLTRAVAGVTRPTIAALRGAERLAAVLDLIYRPEFARGLAVEKKAFAAAAALVQGVRVSQLGLPPHGPAPRAAGDAVLEDLGA